MFQLRRYEKRSREILRDLLNKKSYCLCIPDPQVIQFHLDHVSKTWIRDFLLTKNENGFSVISMFMFIFIKNKHLSLHESRRLKKLLKLLVRSLEASAMDSILLEESEEGTYLIYYLLNQLIQFSLNDFIESREKNNRILALAACIKFLLKKTNAETIARLILNAEGKGFHIIRRIMYAIAHKLLHELQLAYLTCIAEIFIYKATAIAIDSRIFQSQRFGLSFIECSLLTWMQLAYQNLAWNRTKLASLATLMRALLNQASSEKLSDSLLGRQREGLIFIVVYIVHIKLAKFAEEKMHYLDAFFNQWLKKFFLTIRIEQVESMLSDLHTLLLNGSMGGSVSERAEVMTQFFDYLMRFSTLSSHEWHYLIRLKQQLGQSFFPKDKIVVLLHRIQGYFSLFKPPKNRQDSTEETAGLAASLTEINTLITHSAYDRLSYGAM